LHSEIFTSLPAAGEWPLIDSRNVKDMIEEANTTGEYGSDKWRLKYAA